ncbi:MAG: hypothetical protein V3U24_10475 [Candidatus Neomarinimicrobiota bacterium]
MSSKRKLVWITLFAICFGLVEAAVVVYLRNIYYSEGFEFPPKILPAHILRTEAIREGVTIIMLIAMGVLAGKTALARFGAFLIGFGVWDMFYYIWLKIFLDWPETLLDWDILFLIPTPWAAPVLAPLLVCIGLIVCGTILFDREERGQPVKVTVVDWTVGGFAAAIIILSFLMNNGTSKPGKFPWWFFLLGLGVGLIYFLWRFLESTKGKEVHDPSQTRSE